MLLVWSKWRDEDQPWWDDDPETRARNLSTELALKRHMTSVLNLTGGDGPESPQDGGSMPPIVAAALKYGLTPVLLAWLLFLGVTEFRADLKASRVEAESARRALESHVNDNDRRMDRMDRAQDRIVNLLMAQCVNSAKNRQERDDCLRAGQ